MAPSIPGINYTSLPALGLQRKLLRSELHRYSDFSKVDYLSGKVSGTIYNSTEELSSIITEAYSLFSLSNPLHPEIFPGVRKMEAEIVSMVLKLYNSPETAAGSVTSGGTESILMTLKAHRDMGYSKGITNPEMIIPVSAHAAFDKGAAYFNIKLIHIPVNSITGKVDIKKMAWAINRNTILLVGSAPSFPHGIIDDLPEISNLALKHKIGFHVDCCLGGFLIPFMKKAGYKLPHACDFTLPGVTSISVDTHKYGFAPKGSSVIMYRSSKLRNFQYFVATDWPGGVYASPSIAGSRPGALIAGCWAAMLKMGENGYVQSTKEIISCSYEIIKGIKSIPQLRVIGDPLLSVVAFDAILPVKTYAVADLVSRKGWHLNILQFPPAIHIACTMLTVAAVDELLKDVKEAVETLLQDPQAGNGELSAIYGTAASVPDRNIIADVSKGFLDGLTLVRE